MALHIVASRPDPAVLRLPWSVPLAEWSDDYVVPLPRGLSRHIVRIVRVGAGMYAIKETQEEIAFREYRLLRDLQRIGLPAVKPMGVVTGRCFGGASTLAFPRVFGSVRNVALRACRIGTMHEPIIARVLENRAWVQQ